MDKKTVTDILRDTLLFIRQYARSPQISEHREEIYMLADMVHNVPTLLLDWDDLEKNEPKRLVFLIQSFQSNIDVFTQKFPDSSFTRSLSQNL